MSIRSTTPPGDPVVNVVLSQIQELADLDASSVVPDYKLGADMGLNRLQIQQILASSARQLGIILSFEHCRIEDSTAREIVDILKRWQRQVA